MVFVAFLAGVAGYGYTTTAPYAWITLLALGTTAVYLPVHGWVSSDRLGNSAAASSIIKLALSLVGLASTISGWASVALAAYWAYLAMTGRR